MSETATPPVPHTRPHENANGAARTAHSTLAVRLAAIEDAAAAVAVMAGLGAEKPSAQLRGFVAHIQSDGAPRKALAEECVADMSAMMQPGLAALLAVSARGHDATAPALTLWREYHAARTAMLALVPDEGTLGPRRCA